MAEILSTISRRIFSSPLDRFHPLPDHSRRPDEVHRTLQGRQPLPGHRTGRRRHHHRLVLLLPRAEVLSNRRDVQEYAAAIRSLHKGWPENDGSRRRSNPRRHHRTQNRRQHSGRHPDHPRQRVQSGQLVADRRISSAATSGRMHPRGFVGN